MKLNDGTIEIKHLRAFNIELTNDFINNCRTITIFDNRHLHRIELTTWDWSLSLRGIADRWFKLRGIEIESFTYLRDEHLVYLTKDFRTEIYDEETLHIPRWTGGILIELIIDTPNGNIEVRSHRGCQKIYRTDCIYNENYIKEKNLKFNEWL